jgi:hypothetical protein
MASGSASHSRVDPSMSVKSRVTVPVGIWTGLSTCTRYAESATARVRQLPPN